MHLGVIPDGNRRYAESHGWTNRKAYRKAKDVITSISEQLEDRGVDEVTYYLLSEKNLERDEEELETLFDLALKYADEIAEEYGGNGFSLNWASTNPGALPGELREKLEKMEDEFDGEKTVNLLISYDGKKDILNAAERVKENGGVFDRNALVNHLEISSDIDFVIRTGDNPRRECLSGFPIWNASYAEFYHIKKNFPAVTEEDVIEALDHYRALRRKKGK